MGVLSTKKVPQSGHSLFLMLSTFHLSGRDAGDSVDSGLLLAQFCFQARREQTYEIFELTLNMKRKRLIDSQSDGHFLYFTYFLKVLAGGLSPLASFLN